MNIDNISQSKVYYSISEVSKLLDIKPYVLRFWETEFPVLRPRTMRGGRRAYRKDDIKIVMMIQHLLYNERYTIEGAKKKLKEMNKNEIFQLEIPFETVQKESVLKKVKEELREILKLLGSKESLK